MARKPFDWRDQREEYLRGREEDQIIDLLSAQARELLEQTEVHEGFTPQPAAQSLDDILGMYADFERRAHVITGTGPDPRELKRHFERVNYQMLSFGEKLLQGISELYASSRSAGAKALFNRRSQYDSDSLRRLCHESIRRLADHFAEYQQYYSEHQREQVVRALNNADNLVRQADREPMTWELKQAVAFFEQLARNLVEWGDGDGLDRVAEWIDRVRAIEWEDPRFAERTLLVESSLRFIEQVVQLVRQRGRFYAHATQIWDAAREHAPVNEVLRESMAFVRQFPDVLQRSAPGLMGAIREVEEGLPATNVTEFAHGVRWASQVLGVREGATMNEVRDAFREKALKTHPDHAGSEKDAAMVELLEARNLLMRSMNAR